MSTATEQDLAVNGGPKIRTEPWPPRRLFGEEEKQAAVALFDQSIESGREFGYGGPEEEAYCKEFAEFMGGGWADGVNSGTSAVYVALRAVDLPAFTEVVVSPVTDPGGVMPVPLVGCVPIPADTAPGSFNTSPEQIEAAVTEHTSAILVAHIAGNPIDMDGVMEIARKHNLKVIEDCAQAHGATWRGRLVGTFGDAAAFSTMSGKHHATGAQGGVVYTQDEETFWRARRASDRGKPFQIQGAAGYVTAALNLNSNDLAATIGRVQLKRLPDIVARCRKAAHAVVEHCSALQTIDFDTGPAGADSSFWFMVGRLNLDKLTVDLNEFVKAAAAEGIPFAGAYVTPFNRHDWYRKHTVFPNSEFPWSAPEYKGGPNREFPLPNYDEAEKRLFRLKVHENVTEKDAEDVFKALSKVEKAFMK
jgi:dTDP-4-amino-4,6-dideoxygalactose transaminase